MTTINQNVTLSHSDDYYSASNTQTFLDLTTGYYKYNISEDDNCLEGDSSNNQLYDESDTDTLIGGESDHSLDGSDGSDSLVNNAFHLFRFPS